MELTPLTPVIDWVADSGVSIQTTPNLVWQNHLRNEGSVFQDPDQVILNEARMHVNTHTKHLKP
jgi:hypothetical protein